MDPPASASTTTTTPTTPQQPAFPSIKPLPRTPRSFQTPTKRINTGTDLSTFLTTTAYRDILLFLLQLNRSVCPRRSPAGGPATTYPLTSRPSRNSSPPPSAPDPGPRRFGNVSFRKWHELLADRAPALLSEHIPDSVLSFPTTPSSDPPSTPAGDGGGEPDTAALDRIIVLGVIEPYLRVVRRLILTYTLEPAGSHGVWGLDDHSFLPYIFGSAQLTTPVSSDADPMPTEGSVRGAPKTGDIVKPAVVEAQRSENMYFSAVGFINDVKKGPFWEHSPILFDVSGVKDGWGKINKGMLKMFNAEVLQKFPVVQHFTFGSLFSWNQDPDAAPVSQSIHAANQPSYNYPATTAPRPLRARARRRPGRRVLRAACLLRRAPPASPTRVNRRRPRPRLRRGHHRAQA
ncbi:serine/threonine-protein phosphatase 2A activator 1 [Colletotrichum liriopes]|uniref:Serine/threonine-protein phosphatase 2A activator n=1 Tax=Colletotrichum liriopes TaxID=708192 RepID=A0AA37M134_9PEZI|nr:serine/threonine-protein phosphatase 2A activator 1 [Colletotrichum liriopes]